MGKWVHCNIGGDLSSDSNWKRMFVVLNERGTLSLFDDETMTTKRETFELTQRFGERKMETEFGTFQLTMKSVNGNVEFVFDTEGARKNMVKAIQLFGRDGKDNSVKLNDVSSLSGMLFARFWIKYILRVS